MSAAWINRGAPGLRSRSAAPIITATKVETGREVMAVPEVETAHHAASYMAKDMQTWPSARLSPDAALLPELDTITGRVDDLVRNNGVAAGAERSFIDNVVGPRITCKPNPDRITLGKKASWVDGWAREVEALWATFADTDWFDAGLRYNFHTSTRLQARMIAATGEALALPLWTDRNGSNWRTCLQLVDPARLSNPMGKIESANFRGGIELDPVTTAAIAYNIRKTHPGDIFGYGLGYGMGEWERIPAYMPWGRRRVIHIYESERIGQTRGKAVITSVLRQFKMYDHMNREHLRKAVLNSMIFAALETPLDAAGIDKMFESQPDPLAAHQQMLGDWRINMQGGTMVPLPPGTKLNPFSPNQQLTELDTFATLMLRGIGAGLNMPYEIVFRDFSKTNYSSARASLLEAWRYFSSVRQFLIDHWCAVVYDLWFEEAVNRGDIPSCKPDDYYRNQIAWTRAKWIFSGRGWVDPLKEAKAATERMNSKISTLADEAGEQGRDWREQIDQDAREQAYQKQAYESVGLPWPPAKAPANASQQEREEEAADA
jgi:lambda family phage portal protein